MAKNNVEYNCMISFFESDGITARLMTGKTLSAAMRRPDEPNSPGAIVFTLTIGDGLVIQGSPNDNKVLMTVSTVRMRTLAPITYSFDIINVVSSDQWLTEGSYEFYVEQGSN